MQLHSVNVQLVKVILETDGVGFVEEVDAAGRHILRVVGHHPDDLAGGPRHGLKEFMFTPEQLLPALEGGPEWADVRAEVRDRTQQWDGQEIAVRDSVLVARRA